MAHTIEVDFSRPFPLLALPAVALLPHAVVPLNIFESRYRQMVRHCLGKMREGNILTSGQIAMATIAPGEPTAGCPALRPAVCVAQIVHQEKTDDGRYQLVVHGVCRGRIASVDEPDGERLYRQAMLEPVRETCTARSQLKAARQALREQLKGARMQRLAPAKAICGVLGRGDLPTIAAIEIAGFTLVHSLDARYELLEEPDARRRATLVAGEVRCLDAMLLLAEAQRSKEWPRGIGLN